MEIALKLVKESFDNHCNQNNSVMIFSTPVPKASAEELQRNGGQILGSETAAASLGWKNAICGNNIFGKSFIGMQFGILSDLLSVGGNDNFTNGTSKEKNGSLSLDAEGQDAALVTKVVPTPVRSLIEEPPKQANTTDPPKKEPNQIPDEQAGAVPVKVTFDANSTTTVSDAKTEPAEEVASEPAKAVEASRKAWPCWNRCNYAYYKSVYTIDCPMTLFVPRAVYR